MVVDIIAKLPIKMEGYLDKNKSQKKYFVLFCLWHQTFMVNTWFEPKLIQTL